MLIIVKPSGDEEHEDQWAVSVILGEEVHGWFLDQKGETLAGNLNSEVDDTDLHETQLNILEKCPEWEELMGVVTFKNTPKAGTAGSRDRTVYYNSHGMRKYPQEVQAYIIAEQLMHIQLAHQLRGRGRDRRGWAAACTAVVCELLAADGFEPPKSMIRHRDAAGKSAEEMYDILYEQADREEAEPQESKETEDLYEEVFVSSDRKDADRQAGDLEGAQERDIEDPGLAHAVSGLPDLLEDSLQLDYDWFPADRIRDGMLVEQFRPYPVPHAEILLDTSASIDSDFCVPS